MVIQMIKIEKIKFNIKRRWTLFILKLMPKQFKISFRLVINEVFEKEKEQIKLQPKKKKEKINYDYNKIFKGELI